MRQENAGDQAKCPDIVRFRDILATILAFYEQVTVGVFPALRPSRHGDVKTVRGGGSWRSPGVRAASGVTKGRADQHFLHIAIEHRPEDRRDRPWSPLAATDRAMLNCISRSMTSFGTARKGHVMFRKIFDIRSIDICNRSDCVSPISDIESRLFLIWSIDASRITVAFLIGYEHDALRLGGSFATSTRR